jgi:hypothetical protein
MAQTRGTLHSALPMQYSALPMQCLATSTLGGRNAATIEDERGLSKDYFPLSTARG